MLNYSSQLSLRCDATSQEYILYLLTFEVYLFICSTEIYYTPSMGQGPCSALRIRDGKDTVPALKKVPDD